MYKYFLVTCPSKNTLNILVDFTYIHIKAYADGTKIIIQSSNNQVVEEEHISLKSKEEAQTILNSWIDEENLAPELDPKGNSMMQDYINLDKFEVNNG